MKCSVDVSDVFLSTFCLKARRSLSTLLISSRETSRDQQFQGRRKKITVQFSPMYFTVEHLNDGTGVKRQV